jgi:hypothetical protein
MKLPFLIAITIFCHAASAWEIPLTDKQRTQRCDLFVTAKVIKVQLPERSDHLAKAVLLINETYKGPHFESNLVEVSFRPSQTSKGVFIGSCPSRPMVKRNQTCKLWAIFDKKTNRYHIPSGRWLIEQPNL